MSEPIRVWYLEDDADTYELLELFAKQTPVTLRVFSSCRDFWAAFEKSGPEADVLLLDIRLPDGNGMEVAQEVRRRYRDLPLVITSAYAGPAVEVLYELDAVFIPKPWGDVFSLIEVLRRQAQAVGPDVRSSIGELLYIRDQLRERLAMHHDDPTTAWLVDEIDRLAAGIAHDLKSPLAIIQNTLDTLGFKRGQLPEALERIERRTGYCQLMVADFLGIGFIERFQRERMDLNAVVSDTLRLLEGKIAPNIKVVRPRADEVSILANEGQVKQVVATLVVNALEAMPAGGEVRIDVSMSDDVARVEVTDTGTGIPAKIREQIFALGYSSKQAHPGIGLFVANKIMRYHGGAIYYHETERGAQFSAHFPRQANPSPEGLTLTEVVGLRQEVEGLRAQIDERRQRALPVELMTQMTQELGRICSTFASNLTNELGVIENTVDLLLEKGDSELALQALVRIKQSCAYCNLLTKNLSELTPGKVMQVQPVDVHEALYQVVALLERKMPDEMFQLRWDLDPTLPLVEADPVQIRQVFVNLIRNALDAMQGGGTLILSTRRENDRVWIEVSDTGMGIAPENLERIFDLRFTTKREGYGIGLYTVRAIVERHGGSIKVNSTVGSGTTFAIQWPTAQQPEVHSGDS
ncbi:MAG: hybrid sensor histidine kinase/response regulator [Anaerolineae bacterium]|jgi:signal transduction histidine kinase